MLQNLYKLSNDSSGENIVEVPPKKKNSPAMSTIVMCDDTEYNDRRDLCENAKILCELFICDGLSFGCRVKK